VVHRLVNDSELEIVVVMSNAELPETGGTLLAFPTEVLAAVRRYRAAASLPQGQPRRSTQGSNQAGRQWRRLGCGGQGPAGPGPERFCDASRADGP